MKEHIDGPQGALVRVAVDAMGGDRGPEVLVRGAVEAARRLPLELILVGAREQLEPILERVDPPANVRLRHASDVIAMGAHPVEAVKKQRDSSIVVAANMVKEGEADALVSAGSTGAAMACSLLTWGRIPGIERPAISTLLPTRRGISILLDAGAQVDCRPKHLCQFAVMGSLYAEKVLGIATPKVGLLSNGEEEAKGSEAVREAHAILKSLGSVHFIGNVEGRDIFPGKADVVVCDGFVGNVVLKFAESMGQALIEFLQEAVSRNALTKAAGAVLRPALRDLRKRMDYAEYGGAPLLGVQGVCIISHGASDEKAIMNAVRVARESVMARVVEAIAANVGENGRWGA